MYEMLLLRRAFTDRSGKIVYHAFPVTSEETPDGNQLKEGPVVGMVRLAHQEAPETPNNANVEWLEPSRLMPWDDQPDVNLSPGGVDGGGTG